LRSQSTVGILRPISDHQALRAERNRFRRLPAASRSAPTDAIDEHFREIVLIVGLRGGAADRLANDHMSRIHVRAGAAVGEEVRRSDIQLLLEADAREIDFAGARTAAERNRRMVGSAVAEAENFNPGFGARLGRLPFNSVYREKNLDNFFYFLLITVWLVTAGNKLS